MMSVEDIKDDKKNKIEEFKEAYGLSTEIHGLRMKLEEEGHPLYQGT
jgi:hypothetical protein